MKDVLRTILYICVNDLICFHLLGLTSLHAGNIFSQMNLLPNFVQILTGLCENGRVREQDVTAATRLLRLSVLVSRLGNADLLDSLLQVWHSVKEFIQFLAGLDVMALQLEGEDAALAHASFVLHTLHLAHGKAAKRTA